MPKILLIDDDVDVLNVNKHYLKKEGYDVKTAKNANSGINILRSYSADCIILDVMMPNLSGFDASKEIRSITNAPFIFLSGRTTEEDKLNGFSLGADDYLTKPYSLKELSARIHVAVRRNDQHTTDSNVLSFPPLRIDTKLHKAFFNDSEIFLSNREYELLYLLAINANKTVTFEQIGNMIWGSYSNSDRRTIMVNASRLRKKFEDFFGLSNLIETVWSKGYCFRYEKGKVHNYE